MLTILLFATASLAAARPQPAIRQLTAELAAGHYAEVIERGRLAAAQFHRSGDAKNEGLALTAAGLAELYSGAYTSALDSLTQALQIARATHDGDAEITRLNDTGTVYYFEGLYSDAMSRYREAQRRLTAYRGASWHESRRQLTIANIAILYQTLGKYEDALDLYTDLTRSGVALPPQEQAQLLTNMGALRRRLGDPLKALDTYRTAAALYRKAEHRDGEIAVLNNIGIVQAMDLRDFRAARASFSTAVTLAEAAGDRPLAVHAYLYRGEAAWRAGLYPEAGSDFESAAQMSQALHEVEEHWKALYGLARVREAVGDVKTAKVLAARAVAEIESMRQRIRSVSMRSDFLADKQAAYDFLIEHTADAREIFRLLERSRARNLRDRMHASAGGELSVFERSLPRDTAVLEYWVGPSSGGLLSITTTQAKWTTWPLTAADRAALESFAGIVSDRRRRDWRSSAQTVARLLLSGIPALAEPQIRYLQIIPDGPLAKIPFEVLPLRDSTLLVERFAVSYAPATDLVATRASRRTVRWPWQASFEAFADPSPGPSPDAIGLTSSRAWSRLPAAIREVSAAGKLLGGRAEVHDGTAARKSFLYGPQPPIVHFATHAFVDPFRPDGSYLLLASPAQSEKFDYLFLKEAYDLPFHGVELATLSACETGSGVWRQGEGVEDFSRAFLAAGARAVVASLWNVGDSSTAVFMLRFYTHLASGDAKAAALRAAKLEFLRNPASAHPAYWAAFVLNGDGRSPAPYDVSWLQLGAFAGALACAIALLLRTRVRRAQRSRTLRSQTARVSARPM